MAARKSKYLGDQWRARIQTSMLINRLQAHAKGDCEMSATQIKAAEILLRKCAPDLAVVEHIGEVEHIYVARLPETPKDITAWQKEYEPKLLQ